MGILHNLKLRFAVPRTEASSCGECPYAMAPNWQPQRRGPQGAWTATGARWPGSLKRMLYLLNSSPDRNLSSSKLRVIYSIRVSPSTLIQKCSDGFQLILLELPKPPLSAFGVRQ